MKAIILTVFLTLVLSFVDRANALSEEECKRTCRLDRGYICKPGSTTLSGTQHCTPGGQCHPSSIVPVYICELAGADPNVSHCNSLKSEYRTALTNSNKDYKQDVKDIESEIKSNMEKFNEAQKSASEKAYGIQKELNELERKYQEGIIDSARKKQENEANAQKSITEMKLEIGKLEGEVQLGELLLNSAKKNQAMAKATYTADVMRLEAISCFHQEMEKNKNSLRGRISGGLSGARAASGPIDAAWVKCTKLVTAKISQELEKINFEVQAKATQLDQTKKRLEALRSNLANAIQTKNSTDALNQQAQSTAMKQYEQEKNALISRYGTLQNEAMSTMNMYQSQAGKYQGKLAQTNYGQTSNRALDMLEGRIQTSGCCNPDAEAGDPRACPSRTASGEDGALDMLLQMMGSQ